MDTCKFKWESLAPKVALELNDGKSGLINYIGTNVTSAVTPKVTPSIEPEMKEAGYFPISEIGEKNCLVIFLYFLLRYLCSFQ